MKRITTIILLLISFGANAQTGYLVQPAKWKFTRPQWLDSGAWIKNISKYGGQQRVLVYDSVTNKIGYKYISNGATYTAGRGLTLNSNIFRLDTATVSNLAYISENSSTTAKSIYQMSSTVPIHFKSSDANTLLYLDETNERVGIGTASPTYPFTFNQSSIAITSTSTAIGRSAFFGYNNGYRGLQIGVNSTGAGFIQNVDNTTTAYSFSIQPYGGELIIGSYAGLAYNGNKLAVNGNIYTNGLFKAYSAPTASPNFGLVSLGSNNFTGSGITGSSYGTILMLSEVSGFGGDYINAGKGTTSYFKVDNVGNVTAKNGKLSGVLFSQTATATVANTTTETTVTSTGSGSLTLPANFFEVGKTLVIHAEGFHSATANPNITVKIKLGGTTYLTSGTVVSGNSTNAYLEIKGTITCRTTGATGTVFAQGFFVETGGGDNHFGMPNTTTQTIDTTVANAVDVTVQWGTASANNTISITNLLVEGKN